MSRIIKYSQVNLLRNEDYYRGEISFNSNDNDEAQRDANAEYENVMEVAKKQAKDIINDAITESACIKDSIISDAEQELEQLKKEAYDNGYELGMSDGESEGYKKGYGEGYQKGYDEGKEESLHLIQEAEQIKSDSIDQKDNMLEKVESDVVDLVVSITKTVLNKKIDEDDETIVNLVMKGLDSLSSRENIRIRVSSDDFEKMCNSKDEVLAKVSLIEDLQIDMDSNLEKGDCIIESSKGDIDVSVDTQLKNIEESVRTLLDSE